MSNITKNHEYNGTIIPQRMEDDYVDITALCQSEGKKINDYLRLKSTKAYVEALSVETGIPVSRLLPVQHGNRTYAHPEIAMDCAQWVSIPCRIWANRTLVNLVKADSGYRPTHSSLPPHIEAEEVSKCILNIHENLADIDPRLAQILIDRAMQTVQPLLPAGDPEVQLSGAVEMAEKLGFRVGKEQSTLGKTIAKAWRDAYGGDPQEVKRECGGAMRKLKVYPSDDPIVIATIKEFYSDREAA